MTALFVIDVQQEYITRYDASLLPRINRLIDEACARGELVVYVKNAGRRKGERVYFELADGLHTRSDSVLLKDGASAFADGAAHRLLNERGVTKVSIIGVDGCECVAKSAAGALALGYGATLICGGIGARDVERFERKKRELARLGASITE